MSRVFHMLLVTVAVIWGVSAVVVVAIFAVDERAFRRLATEQAPHDRSADADVRHAPHAPARQLAASTAG